MRFGNRLRQLRKAKGLTLRELAKKVGVGFTYLSRAENERLQYGDYPSNALIEKLAKALNADADELFFLAQRIPDRMKRRILERPFVFRKLAELDDAALERVVAGLGDTSPDKPAREKRTKARR
jgi:transcriptional regulator with XRE-family HTH domain